MEGDRIVAVGSDEALLAEYGKQNAVNAQGQAVIPGLTDAHLHLEHYALSLQKINCETATRQECLQRVAERAQTTPPGEWILGHGWNQNTWPEGFGSAADLDAVAPQHPVFLTAKSLHAAWANHAALQLAGVSAATPDPQGGRFGRLANGDPDGILFESATQVVQRAIPEPSTEQVVEAISAAQPRLWQMGLTGVHDFDRRRCFSALQVLHARGELGLRTIKSIPLEDLPYAVALGLRSGFGDDLLRIGSVKAFADGALGPQTAAMLAPYEGSNDQRGMLLLDAEQLFEHGCLAAANGLSLAVHAIGDRANHEVIEAFARLREYERGLLASQPPTGCYVRLRHRIEHVQLLHPQDTGRLAELGLIASMQPIHASSDMLIADRFWGPRAALAYAWRTQLDHGARLVFGSDAPVESPNPFWGIHVAVTRRRINGEPGPAGWYPEQRLALDEALHAFTTGPAYAAGLEERLGRLSPGFLADLLLLETDPFTCPPDQLHSLQPSAVMVAGKWVFKK